MTDDDILHVACVVWRHSPRGIFEFDDVLQEARIVALTEDQPGFVYYKTLNALTVRYRTRKRLKLVCDVSREIDVTKWKSTTENLDVQAEVDGLLARLTEFERYIVRRVFWDDLSLKAISRESGYAYQTVWKRYWRALCKMGAAPMNLAPRQVEVLDLIRQGLTLRETAEKLGIDMETARGYRSEARWRLKNGANE